MAVSPQIISAQASVISTSIYDDVKRSSDSILRLKDGQCMVIGGLLNTNSSNSIVKLPFLGDLPLVGGLFRYNNKSKSNQELLIFLTPHIIDEQNQDILKSDHSSQLEGATTAVKDDTRRIEDVDQILNIYESKRS